MTIRLIVADDHDLVRSGLVRILSDVPGISVVAEAANGEDALKLARLHEPDVILMDVLMPGMGGIEATKRISNQMPRVKIVALSAMEENPFPVRLVQAGALGYITKGAELSEMVTAIKHAAQGKRFLSPAIAQQLALHSIDGENANSPFEQLSERELQICMMVINCEKVQDISDKLCLSPKTVNSYRYRIFEKLNINGDVELTRLAIRHGLIDSNDI